MSFEQAASILGFSVPFEYLYEMLLHKGGTPACCLAKTVEVLKGTAILRAYELLKNNDGIL